MSAAAPRLPAARSAISNPALESPSAAHGEHAIYQTRLYRGLRRLIAFCVRRRGLTVLATVAIFAASIVAFGNVSQQFFPLSERPELFLQIRMPEGSAIGVTTEAVAKAERILGDDPDIATHTSYIGRGSPRFWLGLNPQLPNEAFAEIVIVARDVVARERIKARVEAAVADGALAEARVRVDRFTFGPPVGFPVQFRVIGPDPVQVRTLAYDVRETMRANRKVLDPHLDWNELTPSVRLVVDQERARTLGLDPQTISQTLQTLISGFTITSVRDGTERVDVVARAPAAERLDLARIGDLTIVSRNGVPVPLSQVGRIEYGHEEPILWRRNRDTAITVRADVVDGAQPPDVTGEIWPTLGAIRDRLPTGYRLEIGGAVEESAKGNASLAALFPIMIIAMLTLLMVQLQNFSRLVLVFLTAPLGIIGASLALNLSGKPFGFVALLGLIALAGMIMRNAVILVDQIETDVEHGSTRREAIVEATVRRARPVVLTALAAILAMIPLSGSAFWGPMAYTIMGGLFVATFLTLLFLPLSTPSGSARASTREPRRPTASASRHGARNADRSPWRRSEGGRELRAGLSVDPTRHHLDNGPRPRDHIPVMSSSIALAARPETDTRQRIEATAERLFREIGYQKTTVADIAKALKMSPANVYRFFDSKRAINEAVAERMMAEVEAALAEIADGDELPVDRLRRLIATYHGMNAERFTTNQKMHDMVEAAMVESWDVIVRHIDRANVVFARVIRAGQRSGDFRAGDPDLAAACVKCALMRFFHPQLIAQCADVQGATLEDMTDFVLRALGAKVP
jgi:AcrR family transcriptional regulator